MTVKLECVYKHVVHDWKEAASVVGWCIAGLGGLVLLCYVGSLLASPIVFVLNAVFGLFTAYNLLVALTAINVIGFTFGAAYRWNEDSFKTSVNDVNERGVMLSTSHEEIMSTWSVILISAYCEAALLVSYMIIASVVSGWYIFFPNPAWVCLAWTICAIIGIPIACAIARCKE
jgi:hypothetical protein